MTEGVEEHDTPPDEHSPSNPDFVPLARPVEPAFTDPVFTSPLAASDSMLLLGMRRGEAVRDLLTIVVLVLGAELVVGLVAGLAMGLGSDGQEAEAGDVGRTLFLPLLFFRAATVVVIVWRMLRHRGQPWSAAGVGMRRLWQNLLFGIVAVVAAAILSYGCQLALMAFWPKLLKQMIENAEIIMAMIPKRHPLVLGLLSMAVAVYEELLFRGFLLPRLRRATNSWVLAVLLSTVLFTSLHARDQTMAAMVPITILSLVFCMITIWRRSIVPAVFGHFFFNFVQFLYLYMEAGDSWA